MPIRTILVGTDGSPGATRAVAWATVRAEELGASILAVHVLTYSTEFRRDLFLDTITAHTPVVIVPAEWHPSAAA